MNDGPELFDVLDEEGRPTGATKLRRLVHQDGDWHASLHLWIVLGDRLVLQRRGREKDTYPGFLDIAVAGHLRAGETWEDALRESEEEIGITVRPSDVVRLGTRRNRYVRPPVPGEADLRDFEHQTVLLARPAIAFEDLRPGRPEVESVVLLELSAFASLARGTPAAGLELASQVRAARFEPPELLPRLDDYYERILAALERGGPPFALG
jgi:isopentenyldiphosphate isomerase